MEKTPDFRSFHLRKELLEGLSQLGYTHPTPVQRLSIPAVMEGTDLMVQAKTGSGKTLAFGLPILNRIDPLRPECQALILAPTRELALQVASELHRAAGGLTLVSAVYGGVPIKEHMMAAQWSALLVGTPGRVRDLLERGVLRLDNIKTVVLDEADEMLDMGFKNDLEFILDAARSRKQTLLFSATFPKDILALARKYMHEAKRLQAEPAERTPTEITHRAVLTAAERRLETLIDVLKAERPESCIIFCQTKSETPWLARKLKAVGFSADCLHGDMNQGQRFSVLEAYRAGSIQILVATEVAARGLDVAGVSHVINYEVPQSIEHYVHRSGRTGRAGKRGTSITLVSPREERSYARIEAAIGSPRPAAPIVPEQVQVETAVRARPPQVRRGPSLEEFVGFAGKRAEAHLALARHLLHTADPVTLVAALLADHPLVQVGESRPAGVESAPKVRRRAVS